MKPIILYYYYVEKVNKPDVNDMMKKYQNYSDYYEESGGEVSEPIDIDGVLDIYNKRKKDNKDNLYHTEIYYLVTDLDNDDATKILVSRLENDVKFKGWISPGTDAYEWVHNIFKGTGELEVALKKIVNPKKD